MRRFMKITIKLSACIVGCAWLPCCRQSLIHCKSEASTTTGRSHHLTVPITISDLLFNHHVHYCSWHSVGHVCVCMWWHVIPFKSTRSPGREGSLQIWPITFLLLRYFWCGASTTFVPLDVPERYASENWKDRCLLPASLVGYGFRNSWCAHPGCDTSSVCCGFPREGRRVTCRDVTEEVRCTSVVGYKVFWPVSKLSFLLRGLSAI